MLNGLGFFASCVCDSNIMNTRISFASLKSIMKKVIINDFVLLSLSGVTRWKCGYREVIIRYRWFKCNVRIKLVNVTFTVG